jgi:hypothetical protein
MYYRNRRLSIKMKKKVAVAELPEEIRQAMRLFNKKLSKYEQTEDESLYYELQQDDVAIADGIENWLEDNEADDDDEDDSYLEAKSAQAQAPQQAQATQQAAPQAQAPPQRRKGKFNRGLPRPQRRQLP